VPVRERIPITSVNLSFTDESNRVLSFAEKEADLVGRDQVGIEHLLLGLLREKDCFASRLLRTHGADPEQIRNELTVAPYQPPTGKERKRRAINGVRRDLVEERVLPNLQETTRSTALLRRYTDTALLSIFFARYEACQFGSPVVETEHLLLGMFREEGEHLDLFVPSAESREMIRKEVEDHGGVRKKVALDLELPLSRECERALANAADEAVKLGHERVRRVHLLLGLLREEGCFAAQLLREHGAEIGRIRGELAANP
jgi:ATP-dependent Clp protease ATP-binding subunit ClpA